MRHVAMSINRIVYTVWQEVVGPALSLLLSIICVFFLAAIAPVWHAQALTDLGRYALLIPGVELWLWIGSVVVIFVVAKLIYGVLRRLFDLD